MQHTSRRQPEAVNSLKNPEPHGVSLHLWTRHRPRPHQPHLGTAPAPFRMPRASLPAPLGSLGKRPPSLFQGSWNSRAVLLVSSPGKAAWLSLPASDQWGASPLDLSPCLECLQLLLSVVPLLRSCPSPEGPSLPQPLGVHHVLCCPV